MNEDASEFTESGFRSLIHLLKQHDYGFARYGEERQGRQVLWRHDVDFSMHRAAKLAAIEAEEGVLATYFLYPRSPFYNLLEPGVLALARQIRAFGHDIGLHFDAGAFDRRHWERDTLDHAVAREQGLLEMILEAPVRSVSWHNPDMSNLLDFDDDVVGGLHNAYAASLRERYVYCSDSNGYWRHEPMTRVISAGHSRLHLLTHPEWWTPEPMSPSDRIDRAIEGRARAVRKDYDDLLVRAKRKNIGR